MGAVILDGRALAGELRADLRARTARLRDRGVVPRLVVVIAGEDPASVAYAGALVALGEKLGIDVAVDGVPHDADEAALRARLEHLSGDRNVHGIILQQPLPRHLALAAVAGAIAAGKDVDAANPATIGRLASAGAAPFVPATAAAIMLLLERSPHAQIAGARACVIGRSRVVGLPVALLLIARSATVTVTHSKTRDLAHHTRDADIVVAAAGVPGLVGAGMVARGATVIDAGTSYANGKVAGDVNFAEVAEAAGAITPVPGGVGPVTNVALMRNVVSAAERDG